MIMAGGGAQEMIFVGEGRDVNQHPFLETAERYWLQFAFLNHILQRKSELGLEWISCVNYMNSL